MRDDSPVSDKTVTLSVSLKAEVWDTDNLPVPPHPSWRSRLLSPSPSRQCAPQPRDGTGEPIPPELRKVLLGVKPERLAGRISPPEPDS